MIQIEMVMSRRVKFNRVKIVTKVTSNKLTLNSFQSGQPPISVIHEDLEVRDELDRNNLTSRII